MASRSPRVLVVYGSESGSTKRLINKVMKTWKAKGATFPEPDIMAGNDAMAKYGKLEAIAENYDVLLVATCSYGCGEAPVNISLLLSQLLEEADRGSESQVLLGMQHAVLGCGSTFYETFQNCPRLHDKFLGECGSRRLVMRAEIDDADELPKEEQPHYLRWVDEVFACLQALPAHSEPPACAWDQPAGRITESMSLSTSVPSGNGPEVLMGVCLTLAAASVAIASMGLLPENGLFGLLGVVPQ